jgi:aminoglycoside phosphotransferase (APT) family kinase protein
MMREAQSRNNPLSPSRRADSASLVEVLQSELSHHFGRATDVRNLERRPFKYSTSFALEALDVTLANGVRLELVFKDFGPASLSAHASEIRPPGLYDPRREIALYQTLLAGGRLGVPVCYAAVADDRAGRYWLFLERVQGARLSNIGEFPAWEDAACWLARLHASYREDAANLLDRGLPLLQHDEAFYRLWADRARRHVSNMSNVAADRRRALESIADRYDVVIGHLMRLPATLIHGEFYGSNVLCRDNPHVPSHSRVSPIDWEMAAIGPGLLDLAALTSGRWTATARQAMTSAYRSAAVARGLEVPSLPRLLDMLNWCQLHLAIQWLGWSHNWQAPPDQAQDWLKEAVRLGRQLMHA